MAPREETRILFIQYDATKGTKRPDPTGQISQQMHAAREFHRKNKEKKKRISVKSTSESNLKAKSLPHPEQSKSAALNTVVPIGFSGPGKLTLVPGAGKPDPFDAFPVSNPPAYVCEVLHYSVTGSSAIYEYCNPNDSELDRRRYYMDRAMHSPAAFCGVILNSGGYHDLKRYGSDVPQANIMLRLKYKKRFLEEMNHEVQKYGSNVPNHLLYAMLSVTTYGSAERLVIPPSESKPSVLATAYDLDYYSRLPREWAHLRALYSIIKQRGGLAAIPRKGFAVVVGLTDLMLSFQRLQPPFFPSVESIQDVMSTWPSPSTTDSHPCSTLGTSFLKISGSYEYMSRLFTIIDAVVKATIGYIDYRQEASTAPSLRDIVRARTAIQHDLLSLPSSLYCDSAATDDGNSVLSCEPTSDETIYNVIHLSTHAYMLQTLFPLPHGYGPHPQIAALLLQTIESFQSHLASYSYIHTTTTNIMYQKLLLWATMLAGIISTAEPDLTTNSRLAHLAAGIAGGIFSNDSIIAPSLGVNDWPNIKSILSQFLWLDEECDKIGYEFWVEICRISAMLLKSSRKIQ